MKSYYILRAKTKRYHEVRAYSLADVQVYERMKYAASRPVIVDEWRDVPKGFSLTALSELPFGFKEAQK